MLPDLFDKYKYVVFIPNLAFGSNVAGSSTTPCNGPSTRLLSIHFLLRKSHTHIELVSPFTKKPPGIPPLGCLDKNAPTPQ